MDMAMKRQRQTESKTERQKDRDREIGFQFHSMGAEAWNARESKSALHCSPTKRILMIVGNEEGYKGCLKLGR